MKARKLSLFIIFAALFSVAFYETPRTPDLATTLVLPAPELTPEQTPFVIPGAEKHIEWLEPSHKKTPLALVYLHGFSASRQEVAPFSELLAKRLGANLYLTRLAAHGFPADHREEFRTVKAEDWLRDAAAAMSTGLALGDKVVLIGMSTGAPLALALAAEYPDKVAAVVLLAPNFAPATPLAQIFNFPGGEWLGRRIVGNERTWHAKNSEQEKYWSTSYDLNAVTQMMRLLKVLHGKVLSRVKAPTLIVYTNADNVISVPAIKRHFPLLGAQHKELVEFSQAQNHIIAGRILSPDTTEPLVDLVARFLGQSK